MAATATPASIVRRRLYIDSGMKNGFYTLRVESMCNGYHRDSYLRNLSTDPDKAEQKARAYFDRVYGPDCLDVVFDGWADFNLTDWGTALQPWEREQLKAIDAGLWPFGKYKGQPIHEAPDSYLIFWAQKAPEGPVLPSLIELCRSIADERGLVAKYEERRAAIAAQKAADAEVSQHVGTVGERRDWELIVRHVLRFETDFGWMYIHLMVDNAGNVVVGKFSKALAGADEGKRIRIKATVKSHGEREGVKQTVVNRPKLLG